mmetsp:Transcript_2305/g.8432  ORF Transcript_2305/g.8432 Transcript_2305/m.8432 type:complete len:239 (-) Transcript_2305:142-858(-)
MRSSSWYRRVRFSGWIARLDRVAAASCEPVTRPPPIVSRVLPAKSEAFARSSLYAAFLQIGTWFCMWQDMFRSEVSAYISAFNRKCVSSSSQSSTFGHSRFVKAGMAPAAASESLCVLNIVRSPIARAPCSSRSGFSESKKERSACSRGAQPPVCRTASSFSISTCRCCAKSKRTSVLVVGSLAPLRSDWQRPRAMRSRSTETSRCARFHASETARQRAFFAESQLICVTATISSRAW